MSPEFAGIHTLYLDSRIAAWRMVAVMMLVIALLMTGYAMLMEHKMRQMQYDLEHGNNVRCDPGYIAKVVDGTKVICIMKQLGPGDVTRKIRR